MLVCVCYSKAVCLLAVLVSAACGWQEVVFHSNFNVVSHPPIAVTVKTQREEGKGKKKTAKVEWARHIGRGKEGFKT